ncbi:MAG: acetyl-CoA decarbonylase/synthase complex subunit alpha/beta, partial [Planctomycetota bacterium]
FYSCTLCQSFAPNHVCVITPERTGLCGAYNWFDGKAAYKIDPTGPNQPITKGEVIDEVKGQWKDINAFVYEKSRKALDKFNAYSIMEDPMTSCGCFECIAAILPLTNGIMTVNREFSDMTPCGMKFSTLAGTVGGGQQIPGFVGHSKSYIASKKFIQAEGGLRRLVWMPKALKDDLKDTIIERGKEHGIDNLYELIADETTCNTEEEVMAWVEKVGHPAMTLDPLM